MGTSGMSTGVHLHWECWVGKSHGWTDNGKGFLEPIEFMKAQIKKAKVLATKDDVSPDDLDADAPKAPASSAPAAKAPAAETPAPAATEKPAPAAKPKRQVPAYTVKSGDSYWAIAERFLSKHGNGEGVAVYTKRLQRLNKNKGLNPGDKIRLA
jgi:nucleoid-associated protein YgaU